MHVPSAVGAEAEAGAHDEEGVELGTSPAKSDAWDDGHEAGREEAGVPESDSLLYQLQKVFLNLTRLQATTYDPSSFVRSFKGWDGEPINVNMQWDVHEFWSMLYDRLEADLKTTKQPHLLHNTFGGVVVNELICQGCPHRFTRTENFSHISVDIQHASNLAEGLAKFVGGEMLAGSNAFYCGTCKTKVDTFKRTVVQSLPSTLVLHLKRFEFKMDTMRKQKLNNRFPFPTVLDMRPYTLDGVVSADVLQQQLQQVRGPQHAPPPPPPLVHVGFLFNNAKKNPHSSPITR